MTTILALMTPVPMQNVSTLLYQVSAYLADPASALTQTLAILASVTATNSA